LEENLGKLEIGDFYIIPGVFFSMIKLGQRLHDQRVKKGLSIDDVTKATKIRPSFLGAIESSEYQKLPASAYAQGFVANYAEYLGFSRREALALFRREFDEAKIFSVLPERFTNPADTKFSRIKIQHTTLLVIFASIALLSYLGYSYKDAFINPPLSINSIKSVVGKSGDIIIQGKANHYDTVMVNNAPVYLNNDGTFSKTISAFPGNVPVTIKVTNRFGRTTIIEKIVNVKE
jgi:hypothetical protein